jgi:hypothetical protein
MGGTKHTKKTILRGFSPRGTYTNRATPLVGKISADLRIEGATWSA